MSTIRAQRVLVIFPRGSSNNTITRFVNDRKLSGSMINSYTDGNVLAALFESKTSEIYFRITTYLNAGYEFITKRLVIDLKLDQFRPIEQQLPQEPKKEDDSNSTEELEAMVQERVEEAMQGVKIEMEEMKREILRLRRMVENS